MRSQRNSHPTVDRMRLSLLPRAYGLHWDYACDRSVPDEPNVAKSGAGKVPIISASNLPTGILRPPMRSDNFINFDSP